MGLNILKALSITIGVIVLSSAQASDEDPTPSYEIGAKVFSQRCILCHGSQAMGDGALPLKIKDYPDTNLRTPKKSTTTKEIHDAIVFGGAHGKLSEFMPPFGNELSWTELESVTQFITLIRSNAAKALPMVERNMQSDAPSQQAGQTIYSTRCVLCHGKYGEGDGRMSKLLKDPPPADLTASRLPDDYLQKIITLGGEGVGRSKHMPPWQDQLNKKEISNVIEYLKSIRD